VLFWGCGIFETFLLQSVLCFNAASWVPEKFKHTLQKNCALRWFPLWAVINLWKRNIYKLFNCLKEIKLNQRIYLEIFLMYMYISTFFQKHHIDMKRKATSHWKQYWSFSLTIAFFVKRKRGSGMKDEPANGV